MNIFWLLRVNGYRSTVIDEVCEVRDGNGSEVCMLGIDSLPVLAEGETVDLSSASESLVLVIHREVHVIRGYVE